MSDRIAVHHGDCLDVLRGLPENSVDSVVTDPPYHLTSIVKRFGGDGASPAQFGTDGAFARASRGFMGKEWDGGDIAFRPDVWRECLRVLKPGGYLLAFASTRGFGRMSVAIEDAGFIVHPFIAWIFGSGFPKATRIKAEGYDGWRYGGQALKPAIEPIFMGQKPFSEKTGTANILKWGTGAINIDGCRVPAEEGANLDGGHVSTRTDGWDRPWKHDAEAREACCLRAAEAVAKAEELGRWPANVIHDGSEEVLEAFPDALGQRADASGSAPSAKTSHVYGKMGRGGEVSAERRYTEAGSTNFAALPGQRRNDSGTAARFFYSAKADSEDRLNSKHPTVKPVDLMAYLCRLVTPPGGTVLDPFAGSGTTGMATLREGFKAVLIEREVEYVADIRRRIAHVQGLDCPLFGWSAAE